jgi:hypothetical protein
MLRCRRSSESLRCGRVKPVCKTLCLLLILLSLCVLPARTATGQGAKDDSDRQELTRLVSDECEAVLENHAAVLARIWAAEFQMHTVDNKTTPRNEARAYLRTALPQSISGLCEISDLNINVHGRKATMTGRMKVNATATDGTSAPVQFGFNQKLVKRNGRWQATFLDFSYVKP